MISKLLPYILFCTLVVGKLPAQTDTVRVRKSVDSLLALDKKLWSLLETQPSLATVHINKLRPLGPSALLFQCYYMLANTYVRNGENELARAYLDTCRQIGNKLGLKRLDAKIDYLEGIYLKFNGKSDQALRKWFTALEIFRAEGDESAELGALSAIAKEYNYLNQNDQAERYLKEIIARKEKRNDQMGLGHSYNTLANVYADTKRYDEAIAYFRKAAAVSVAISDTVNLAYTFNNLARVYNKQGRLGEAYQNWTKSYELFMCTTDAFGIAMVTNNMAYVCCKQKNYHKAIDFARKAVDYATVHDIQLELLRAHQNLMDAYYGLNDFPKGYKEYEIILDMKDAQFNKDVASALAESEHKYQSKIRQDSLVMLHAEKKLSEALLEKQQASIQSYQIGLVTIALLIVAIAALSYTVIKNRRVQQELVLQDKLSQVVFETEQSERERIARDLHDSVGQKLSVVKMKLSMNQPLADTTTQLLDQAIADVRTASHNLLPEDLRRGLVPAIEEIIDQINYAQNGTRAEFVAPDELRQRTLPKQMELYLYRVIQEIVHNALKYAQAKNIHINMELGAKKLNVVLYDDGVGMPEHAQKTDGIGLKNIKARIAQLKGKLEVVSNARQGTRFIIDVPL